MRATRSEGVSPAFLIDPADPLAAHAGLTRPASVRSATAGERPGGDRGSSLARPASATPPSGRCSTASASHGRSDLSGSRPTVTSGPVPATSCTWTSPATHAFYDPATVSLAIALSARGARLPRTRARLLRGSRDRRQASDDRQCLRVRQEPSTAAAARRSWDQALDDGALPAAHERQGRALPPDDGEGMGVRTRLPLTSRAQPCPATLARALQPPPTAQLARRPSSDQPRSQRLWVGQLSATSCGSNLLDGRARSEEKHQQARPGS